MPTNNNNDNNNNNETIVLLGKHTKKKNTDNRFIAMYNIKVTENQSLDHKYQNFQ